MACLRLRLRILLAVFSALLLILLVVAAWRGYGCWIEQRRATSYDQCRTAMADERWDDLDTVATGWVEWDTENADAWLFLAEAAIRKDDYARAVKCLGMLSDEDPKVIPALIERVRICFEEVNQPLEAVATCERILRIEPRASRAHSRLIFFYSMTLQRRELVRCVRRAIDARCEPPDAYVYVFGVDSLLFSNALSVNTHWLEAHPNHEPFLVARAVLVALMASDETPDPFAPDAAQGGDQTLMDECLERFPNNLEVLAYHLERHHTTGDLVQSAALLSRAPREAENDSRFWRYKGIHHSERGELDAAVDAFRKALDCHPYDWRARHRLATALRLLGKREEAEQQGSLAQEGKAIEKEIKQLPDTSKAPGDLLKRIAAFAEAAGDQQVAKALRFRLAS